MTSENDLLRWCSSLVRRRATCDGIELAHFTVKEYLLSIDLDKGKRFSPFKICPKKSDKLLGQVCLTYLNLDHLGEYPPPPKIFDNIFLDLESEAQSENSSASREISDRDEAWSDEDEDISNEKDRNCENEDVDSDPGRPSIQTHESNEDAQLYKHEFKKEVIAEEAFKPSLAKFPLLLYAASQWYLHLGSHIDDALVVCLSNKLFDARKSYQFLWWTYAYMCDMQDKFWDRSYADATTLHWAAQLHLTGVCSWLISQGSDVNRISEMGSPLDCALLGDSALYRDNRYSLRNRMYTKKLPGTEEDKAYDDSVSLITLQLISGGARLNKATNPTCLLLPLEIAVMVHPHNNKVINHLLAARASITEHALQIIEGYLERENRISGAPLGTIPSGIAALFSETACNNVSYAVQSTYQRISSKVASISSCEVGPQGITLPQADPDDDAAAIERQFLQASEHGVYESAASLISTLRNSNSDYVDSTLVCGLGLALQNNHENVSQLLLESGVNPNSVDENGDSAAHTAVTRSYTLTDVNTMIRNLQKLVKYGADLTIRNKRGELVFHLAIKLKGENLLEEIMLLMGNKMTRESLVALKPSVLQYAMEFGLDADVDFILQMYQNINPKDHESQDGASLLGLAAVRETDVALRLLYQRGLATNILSRDGSSGLYHATACSSEDPFKFLMDIKAIDCSARSDGRMAIHNVVTPPFVSTSKLLALLRAGENPNVHSADGLTPLLAYANYKMSIVRVEIVQALLNDRKTDVDCRDTRGMTPLMRLSANLVSQFVDREYLAPCIECLMKHRADVELVDSNNLTALHHLCWNGVTSTSFRLIKLFITSGASLFAKDIQGVTPFEVLFVTIVDPARSDKYFSRSIGFEPRDVLEFILDNALDHLNDPLSFGQPPLNFALEKHNATAVSLLLSRKEVDVDIRSTKRDFRTALEIAASSGCTKDVARELLPRSKNSVYSFDPVQGYTVLHFAASNLSDQTMLRELLQSDLNIEALNKVGETPLYTSILQGNLAAVKLLIRAGASTTTAVGTPTIYPLHLAVQGGRVAIVQTLIESGADVNALSQDTKSTALHYASNKGSWGMVSLLLKHGALIDERDISGATPYVRAARANHWSLVRKFNTTSADLNSTDFTGWEALHYAIRTGSMQIVRFLHKHSSALNRDIKDSKGKIRGSTLTCAIQSGNVDLFEMFWEEGAKTFIGDYGYGLAHASVYPSTNEVRKMLLQYDVDWNLSTAWLYFDSKAPEVQSPKGLLPLHVAAARGNDAAITFINDNNLGSGVNALTTGVEAYSALHLGAIFNHPNTIKLLHKLSADLDLKDTTEGQTALHIAARSGFAEIVTALLEAGCQPNPSDFHGSTPELLAFEHEHYNVATILTRHLDSLESNMNFATAENPSTSALKSHRKPWRLPLPRNKQMTGLMTGKFSIYAVHDSECQESLYKALEGGRDQGVYNLGKPVTRHT
jgi:ankyrin repeat protein